MSSEADSAKTRRNLDHKLHCNINARQDRLRQEQGNYEGWEHWLYESKRLMAELRYLPILFQKEREGNLPKAFKYCSLSPVEQLPKENKLVCCLGQEVGSCQILADVFKGTEDFPPEEIDKAKAHVCATHILTEASKRLVDTSEGYITDEVERQFWQRTYQYMSMDEPE